jgi:hypothetical protein
MGSRSVGTNMRRAGWQGKGVGLLEDGGVQKEDVRLVGRCYAQCSTTIPAS